MDITPITDKINVIIGLIVAILAYIFGEHWPLFAFYFILNVFDYVTGFIKSRLARKENSAKGLMGVIKKLGYWIMILIGFGMSAIFIEIGEIIGLSLQVTELVGWFVLATLIVNEIRSIIENFVEAGYKVPKILSGGLEVADKIIEDVVDDIFDEDDEKEEESDGKD